MPEYEYQDYANQVSEDVGLPADEVVEAFQYLDELRTSPTAPNMMGAGPYLMRDLGHTKLEARALLWAWMKHPQWDDKG